MANLVKCGGISTVEQTVSQSNVTVNGNNWITITFTFPVKAIGIDTISISNNNVAIRGISRVSTNSFSIWFGTVGSAYTTNFSVKALGY